MIMQRGDMMDILDKNNQTMPDPAEPERKTYHQPVLKKLRDLRSLTLGGSPGRADSGGSYTNQAPSNANVKQQAPELKFPQ
jgi:hypothetical protein